MPVSKSAEEPGLAAGVSHSGAGNHHPFRASLSAPTTCLLGHSDEHVQSSSLERI